MKIVRKNRSELDYANKLWEFMTEEEEHAYYNEVLDRVLKNPRFYLDHLDELSTFRVSFIHYYPEGYRKRAKKSDS